MKLGYGEICGIGGLVCGVGALGVSVYDLMKTRKMAEKVGVSVERLSGMTSVEIADGLVEKTVQDKVDKIVTQEVTAASRKAVDDVREDMHRTIKKEVDEALRSRSEAIQDRLESEWTGKIERYIDVQAFSDRVMKKCEQNVMDQMKGAVEGVKRLASDKLTSQLSAYNEVGSLVKNFVGK